jgi:cyclopropane fatty-acyl-phospholipid synthase-like methyltransferase
MPATLSPRLQAIVDALPLKPGLRVLEIGYSRGDRVAGMASSTCSFRRRCLSGPVR